MSEKALTQALLSALDLGISVNFEKRKSSDVIYLRMRKETEGSGPVGHERAFTKLECELAQCDILAIEIDHAMRCICRAEERLRVTS